MAAAERRATMIRFLDECTLDRMHFRRALATLGTEIAPVILDAAFHDYAEEAYFEASTAAAKELAQGGADASHPAVAIEADVFRVFAVRRYSHIFHSSRRNTVDGGFDVLTDFELAKREDPVIQRAAEAGNADASAKAALDAAVTVFRDRGATLGRDVVERAQPISLSIEGTTAVFRFVSGDDVKAMDDAVAAHAAAHPDEPVVRAKPRPREVTVELSDPPRLLGYATELPMMGPDKPAVRWALVVEQWQQAGGATLPQRIRTTWTLPDGGHSLSITELSRVSAVPASAPGADDPHPLPEGLRVEDDQQFSFTVGSPLVTYQNRHLRLKAPLGLHPGEGLADLLRDATHVPHRFHHQAVHGGGDHATHRAGPCGTRRQHEQVPAGLSDARPHRHDSTPADAYLGDSELHQ